jgi:hypothetical protein
VAAWLLELARVIGASPPYRIPVWLGRLAAGEVGVRMMTEQRGSSNAKAKRELGWQPSTRAGVTDSAAASERRKPRERRTEVPMSTTTIRTRILSFTGRCDLRRRRRSPAT